MVVEIGGDTAGELADGLHLVRVAELILDGTAIRQVACDLGKADQYSGFVVDRVDDHVCPKLAAVLTDTPAFCLVSSRGTRRFDAALRDTGSLVRSPIKAREVMADDVLGRVSLDPLRSGVPIGNDAVGIEHEDRVIGDALHEETEPALAFLELLH